MDICDYTYMYGYMNGKGTWMWLSMFEMDRLICVKVYRYDYYECPRCMNIIFLDNNDNWIFIGVIMYMYIMIDVEGAWIWFLWMMQLFGYMYICIRWGICMTETDEDVVMCMNMVWTVWLIEMDKYDMLKWVIDISELVMVYMIRDGRWTWHDMNVYGSWRISMVLYV